MSIKILETTTQIENAKYYDQYDWDDMIADMINNKSFNQILTELFIRGTISELSLFFFTKSYLAVPKGVRLSSTFFYDN